MNKIVQMFDWQRQRDMNTPIGRLLADYAASERAKRREALKRAKDDPPPCGTDCKTPFAWQEYGSKTCALCQPVVDEHLAKLDAPCGFACMYRNLYGAEMCNGCPENCSGESA